VPNRSPCVLIVEDDEDDRRMLRDVLASEGLKVREASDGVEAAEVLVGPDPMQLVLLDVRMPRMDGPQFLEWLRGRRELDRVPVVVLTADRDPVLSDRAIAVVRKPFDVPGLLDIVHAICRPSLRAAAV